MHLRSEISKPHQQVYTPPPAVRAQVHNLEGTPWFTRAASGEMEDEDIADCPWIAKELDEFFIQANATYDPESNNLQYGDFFQQQQAQQYQFHQQVGHPIKTYPPQ